MSWPIWPVLPVWGSAWLPDRFPSAHGSCLDVPRRFLPCLRWQMLAMSSFRGLLGIYTFQQGYNLPLSNLQLKDWQYRTKSVVQHDCQSCDLATAGSPVHLHKITCLTPAHVFMASIFRRYSLSRSRTTCLKQHRLSQSESRTSSCAERCALDFRAGDTSRETKHGMALSRNAKLMENTTLQLNL